MPTRFIPFPITYNYQDTNKNNFILFQPKGQNKDKTRVSNNGNCNHYNDKKKSICLNFVFFRLQRTPMRLNAVSPSYNFILLDL